MKPKALYFSLIGLLTVGMVGGIFAYYWASTKLSERSRFVKSELTRSALADERIDQLNSLRVQFKELSPLAAKIENALPRTKKQSEVALQIQQLASQAGMSISNTSFLTSNSAPTTTSQSVKAKSYFEMPITFRLTGSYAQLQAFLQHLESLERYTNITSLSINNTNARSLTFTVNLNTFFKP